MVTPPDLRLGKSLVLVGLLVVCFAGALYAVWIFQSWPMDRAADELVRIGATVDRGRWGAMISFASPTFNDETLVGAVDELAILGPIASLDLRTTEVTGRTFGAFSGLEASELVLDLHQVNPDSIRQLNACRRIGTIRLVGISEDELLGLIPGLREMSASGAKRLSVDLPPGAWLQRLEAEAPRLRGVQSSWGWHPIGEAFQGLAAF